MTITTALPSSMHGLEPVATDHDELRAAFGSFPSGIAALCAVVDNDPVGMVATSFSVGVSYTPPLVLFSVQNHSRTWPRLRSTQRLGVSILGHGQDEISMQLASRTRDRFAGVETTCTPRNSMFLHGAALWLDCEIRSESPAGDHTIVVLEVMGMEKAEQITPLIYHRTTVRSLPAILPPEDQP